MDEITNDYELIEYVKILIEKEDLSQRDLGEITGYTCAEVCRVLNHKRKASHNLMVKLCKYFNIPSEIVHRVYPDYVMVDTIAVNNKNSKKINLNFYDRINKLNQVNQQRVLNYIDFLLDEEIENINKESVNNIIKCMIKKNVEK